jgi:ribosomal protein S18 acetylase RimI-like enzyme
MPSPPEPVALSPCDPDAAEARACLAAYLAMLLQRVPGMSSAHVPLPDPEADAFRPPGGAFLIARLHDRAVGCVSVKRVAPRLGELKRLWVAPEVRGRGLGRRMMAAVETAGGGLGMTHLRLDTNKALTEAIALYRKTGWADRPAFSGYPATHWFHKAL